jgi:phosphatidylethanolamine/phosphatidyl-N-methylethanolamine N-methyltransferase
MHELARGAKPCGVVLIVNHFSVEKGLRAAIEKSLAKHAGKLGWRSEFQYETLLVSDLLRLISITLVRPMGFFTMLEFHKST